MEDEGGGGRAASEACSCALFKLEGTSPAVGSAVGAAMQACEGTGAAAG